MIKFSYALYDLKPALSVNALTKATTIRKGALLKVEWPDGKTGYADLHPWPEFGDEDIEQQLAGLRQLKMSPLVEQAIWLAQRDAQARKEKKSIFEGLPVLRNNYLVPDLLTLPPDEITDWAEDIKSRGYEILKIKVGRNIAEEIKIISRIGALGKFMIRLDFNGVASWQIFEKFMTSLDTRTKAFIDYVEDPVPYDPAVWKDCRRLGKIAIDMYVDKYDFNSEEEPPFDQIILKPAREDVDKIMKFAAKWNRKVTVTSSLDHPVGNLHAYSVAQELSQKFPTLMSEPGCLTLIAYQMSPYATAIQTRGPYILKNYGTGIGYDQMFVFETWNQIKVR